MQHASSFFTLVLMAGLLAGLAPRTARAQAPADTISARRGLTYAAYLGSVGRNNLALAAQLYNLNLAEAAIENAKVFPNPVLTMGNASANISPIQMNQQWYLGIQQTLVLGGKRRKRLDLATSQYDLARFQLSDYLRNLRADATIAYVNALTNEQIIARRRRSYQALAALADANQKLFNAGTVSEVDVLQSRVEAKLQRNELYQAESELRGSLLALSTSLGRPAGADSLYYPSGSLNLTVPDYDLARLTEFALARRADLVAARLSQTVAGKTLRLAQATRVPDIDLALGNNYYTIARNEVAPTPGFNALTATASIALPFSNKYKGDLRVAQYGQRQAEANYLNAELTVRVEVQQAYTRYVLARRQLAQYNEGLLTEAERVLAGRTYSYRRGNASLLDVLNVQRTLNDVYLSFYRAQQNLATQWVELQRATGLWEIKL